MLSTMYVNLVCLYGGLSPASLFEIYCPLIVQMLKFVVGTVLNMLFAFIFYVRALVSICLSIYLSCSVCSYYNPCVVTKYCDRYPIL